MATELVSFGEDFVVKYLNRTFGGGPATDVLRISGNPATPGQVQLASAPSIGGVTGLTITGITHGIIAGANASVTPVSTTLAGTKVGDKVVGVIGLVGTAAFTDLSADFEKTVSTAGKVLQTLVDLSATTSIMVTIAHTS